MAELLLRHIDAFAAWATAYQGYRIVPANLDRGEVLRLTGNGCVDDDGSPLPDAFFFRFVKPRKGDVVEVPDRNARKLVRKFLATLVLFERDGLDTRTGRRVPRIVEADLSEEAIRRRLRGKRAAFVLTDANEGSD